VRDREQSSRRTANPPPTLYPNSRARDSEYDRDSRPARSRASTGASTRASTLHPDDSLSNGTCQPRRRHERESASESRGRSRSAIHSRTQYDTYHDYPPTLSPIPSSRSSHHQSQRERSLSITHAFASDPFDPRLTHTYIPQPAAAAASAAAKSRASASRTSRISSPARTVTHPHGRDPLDPSTTYIWRADERSRRSEAPTHRSEAPNHRSEAPTHRSEAPIHHSEAPTHRTSTSYRPSEQAPISRPFRQSEAPTHHSSRYAPPSGAPPPPSA
jgi:hypothetical protein